MLPVNIAIIRVLLVEDDEYDQFAFRRAVERQSLPYKIKVANTVTKARQVLSTRASMSE